MRQSTEIPTHNPATWLSAWESKRVRALAEITSCAAYQCNNIYISVNFCFCFATFLRLLPARLSRFWQSADRRITNCIPYNPPPHHAQLTETKQRANMGTTAGDSSSPEIILVNQLTVANSAPKVSSTHSDSSRFTARRFAPGRYRSQTTQREALQ